MKLIVNNEAPEPTPYELARKLFPDFSGEGLVGTPPKLEVAAEPEEADGRDV